MGGPHKKVLEGNREISSFHVFRPFRVTEIQEVGLMQPSKAELGKRL